MRFPNPLIKGKLLKRYKRFLADVKLDNGQVVTAHTPNSGSMKGLVAPGNGAYLSFHDSPSRKLKHTLEVLQVGKVKVGVNTHLPNLLVSEAIKEKIIPELKGYEELQREVRYGQNSRIDILLKSAQKGLCYVEVKNVTLVEEGVAYFPDAVTTRGQKHLEELARMVAEGHRAVLFFVLQRADGAHVSPADFIDPRYAQLLSQVKKAGVEVLAYRAKVGLREIKLQERVMVKV